MSAACIAEPVPAAVPQGRLIAPERAADHLTRLYRLALWLCGSPDLAEDLVQETYARLLSRPRWVRGGDDFSYLARILRNALTDHYRRGPRFERAELPPEDLWPADPTIDTDPEAAVRLRELIELVADLPVSQREVVAAVDVAGMSYREAADALGVPVGTVMSRLSRGRERLARELAPAAA